MKTGNRWIGSFAVLLVGSMLSMICFAQDPDDIENSKDHPMFSRMKNLDIIDFETNFDAVEFYVSDENTETVEGQKTYIESLMSNADPLEDVKAAITNKNFIEAHKLLTPLAEDNNVEAQTLLGTLYVNGQGVEKDLEKGLPLIMKAANQGFMDARVMALKLHMDFGNLGDTTAMYNVGFMCLNGWGEERDPNVCLKWLENSAKMGHEKSAEILSGIYTKGMFGVTPNEGKATYWRNPPKDTAMLIIDIQKAFTGIVCRKQSDNMIPVINKLIDNFVKKNIDIIYIRQSLSRREKLDSRLKIVGDNIFHKPEASSFSSNKFIRYLARSQIRHLYITGIAAEYCVLDTVDSALESGYEVTVISDAIAAQACSSLNDNLDKFKKRGAKVLLSEELLAFNLVQ